MARGRGDIRKHFGKRVRDLRRAAGFSQESFAAHVELDRSYMGGVERGARNVSLLNIQKIADGLGIPIGDLF